MALDPTTIERAVRARFTEEYHLRATSIFLAERVGAPDEPFHMTRSDVQRLCISQEITALYRSLGIELGLHGLSYFGLDQPDGRQAYYLAMPGRQRVRVWTGPRPGHPEDVPEWHVLVKRVVRAIMAAAEAPLIPDAALDWG